MPVINLVVKLVLLIALIIFAFTIAFLNGHDVAAYYPDIGSASFYSETTFRLSYIVMGSLLLGFLVGWGTMWTLSLRGRFQAMKSAREAKKATAAKEKLEAEVEKEREHGGLPAIS